MDTLCCGRLPARASLGPRRRSFRGRPQQRSARRWPHHQPYRLGRAHAEFTLSTVTTNSVRVVVVHWITLLSPAAVPSIGRPSIHRRLLGTQILNAIRHCPAAADDSCKARIRPEISRRMCADRRHLKHAEAQWMHKINGAAITSRQSRRQRGPDAQF